MSQPVKSTWHPNHSMTVTYHYEIFVMIRNTENNWAHQSGLHMLIVIMKSMAMVSG